MPLVAIQARRARSSTELLPEAAGPTSGTTGEPDGAPLRIGVLGESTAAGCGVDSHDDGFTGCLARELATRTGKPVGWQVVGQYGATARRIRYRLLPELNEDLNIAVLLAGANDVLSRRTPAQWGEELSAILDGLSTRAEHVVVSGIPPFTTFPSLPATLAGYLAGRATDLDEVSRKACADRPQATWVNLVGLLPADPELFARDGFHPSEIGRAHV